MRFLAGVGATLSMVSLFACKGTKTDAPIPAAQPPAPAPLSWIVYTAKQVGVFAVLEDGSRQPVRLSPEGKQAAFASVLPKSRVLVDTLAGDGSLEGLEAVGVDGSDRQVLGSLPAGVYSRVALAKADGDAIFVQLGRVDAPAKSDILVLKKGAAPAVVASDAELLTAAAGRFAFLANGRMKSAAIDGSEVRALGAATGDDSFVEIRGDRILMTTHAEASGDVRLVRIDGSEPIDLGQTASDDHAFGFARDDLVVWSRVEKDHHAIVATSVDGSHEQVLASAELDAKPTGIAPNGDVLVDSAAGALYLAPLAGGAPKLLDPAAGTFIRTNKVIGDRVFFTGGTQLKVAKLDGSGVTKLVDQATWLPFFATVTPDDRVVFYRALAGQLEGGKLFSVKLDGSDLQPVGVDVKDPDGKPHANVPADQDFEAITPAGRVLLEAEFEGIESHLLIGNGGSDARRITTHEDVKFAALVTDPG